MSEAPKTYTQIMDNARKLFTELAKKETPSQHHALIETAILIGAQALIDLKRLADSSEKIAESLGAIRHQMIAESLGELRKRS